MNLAIIPARSGSKRITNKNIVKFFNKPIIYYSIISAIKANIFDKIIVSTDSEIISKIAKKNGAEVPFLRPKNLSGDNVPVSDVIDHAINYYSNLDINFNFICCIYAASPLIYFNDLRKSLKIMKSEKCEYVLPVKSYDYPVQRGFSLKNGFIEKMIDPKSYNTNSQDLKEFYHDVGQFCWGTSKAWKKRKKVFSKNTKILKIPNFRAVDIDNYDDLKLAKLIYKSIF